MKLNKETLKKYSPFIIIGIVLGLASFLLKRGTTHSPSLLPDTTGSADSGSNVLSDTVQGLKQQLQEYGTETNNALTEQKIYFEGKLAEQDNNAHIDLIEQKNYYDSVVSELTNKFNSIPDSSPSVIVQTPPEAEHNDTSFTKTNAMTKEEKDALYRATYNVVMTAVKSGKQEDVLAGRKAIADMKAQGMDYVTPTNSAVGTFSSLLDKVQVKNNG
jgi:hypothetical protein